MTRPLHQKRAIRLFLVLFLILFQGPSLAAVIPPSFERLAPISANVQSPTGLAIDPQGRVYIAETTRNRVAVFSQSGRFVHAIAEQAGPISVTVADNGHIYIGNSANGSVAVYDSGFVHLFKLGQGDGEFGIPSDIAVSSPANTIYVADRENSTVRAYNADGSFRETIGQHRQRLNELEALRMDFKKQRYDRSGSTFQDKGIIGMVLREFVAGMLDRRMLWKVLREQQRYRPRRSRPDFGSGGFGRGTVWSGGIGDILDDLGKRSSFPGGRGGGGFGRGGGGFRTGGGF